MKLSIFGLLVFALVAFSSCNKDELDLAEPEMNEVKDPVTTDDWEDAFDDPTRDHPDRDRCFKFIYPLTIVFPDGTTVTGDREELAAAKKRWHAAHPDARKGAELQFPLGVVFKGEKIRITGPEELRRLHEACKRDIKDRPGRPCFEFIYPLTIVFPDGTTVTGDREELAAAKKRWHAAHPDARKGAELQFPLGVVFKGEKIRITGPEELRRLHEACKRDIKDRPGRPCFEFIYPLTIVFPDGTTVTGDREELAAAKKRWHAAHPDARKGAELQFPLGVVFKGEKIRITGPEELRRLHEACKRDIKDRPGRPCFEFIYPLTIVFPDGTTVTGDREELAAAKKRWHAAHPDARKGAELQFPLGVVFKGEKIRITGPEELRRLKNACDWTDDKGRRCPDLRGDVGDRCRTDDGRPGVINRHCECEV